MKNFLRVVLIAVAALAAACGSKGKVREPAKLTEIASPEVKPHVVWSASPGSGSGKLVSGFRLAVEDDALFAADHKGRVFALDPRTGKRLWENRTGASVISGPNVFGDLVLVGTLDAEVLALSRADGKLLWRAKVSSEVMAPPAGAGRVVVTRCVDGRVFGLSASDGARLWSFDRSEPALTLRGMSAPLIVGDRVVAGLDNGRLVALSLDDGHLFWEQAIAVPAGRTELERITDIDADLLDARGALYVVSFGGELAVVDPGNGEVGWRRSIKSYTGMAVAGDILAVTDDDGLVWGLDINTGAAAWKSEALKYRRLSAPAALGDAIVVGDFQGYLHWLSGSDGRLIARLHATGDPIVVPPVVHGGLLYVMDTGGRIVAIEAKPRS